MVPIDRLRGLDPLENVPNVQRTPDKVPTINTADSIDLSDEAREAADAYYASQVAAQIPDVRADRVAAVKEQIKDPSYINSAIINIVAERVMDAYGI